MNKQKLVSTDVLLSEYNLWSFDFTSEGISFLAHITHNYDICHLEVAVQRGSNAISSYNYYHEMHRAIIAWNINNSFNEQTNDGYQFPKLKAAVDVATKQIEDRIDPPKHNHYFRPCPYDSVDVYRVLEIFNVTDPCLQHAVKKLLVAGGRGHKDINKDVQDVIDTCVRWQAMRKEEGK